MLQPLASLHVGFFLSMKEGGDKIALQYEIGDIKIYRLKHYTKTTYMYSSVPKNINALYHLLQLL